MAEESGNILGYAYAGAYRTRAAYQWTAETTVYIHKYHQGKGIGRTLYKELLVRLQKLEMKTIIAGIALPNESSIKLHESLGFKHVGTFKNVGFKIEKSWDVGFWQTEL